MYYHQQKANPVLPDTQRSIPPRDDQRYIWVNERTRYPLCEPLSTLSWKIRLSSMLVTSISGDTIGKWWNGSTPRNTGMLVSPGRLAIPGGSTHGVYGEGP